MVWFLIDHFKTFFICCSFPLAGWALRASISKKLNIYIFFATLILLLPALTGYRYLSENIFPILTYILLSSAYSILIYHKLKVRTLSIVLSIFMWIAVLSFSFPLVLGVGEVAVNNEWEMKEYKIKHVTSRGFAGGTASYYELYKYGIIDVFIKKVDTAPDNGDTCVIKFTYKKVNFNKCSIPNM